MDGVNCALRHLEPRCECDHMCKVHEKITCEVYQSTGPLAPHKIVIKIVNHSYKLCERIVYRHGAVLLIVRGCSGFNPRR